MMLCQARMDLSWESRASDMLGMLSPEMRTKLSKSTKVRNTTNRCKYYEDMEVMIMIFNFCVVQFQSIVVSLCNLFILLTHVSCYLLPFFVRLFMILPLTYRIGMSGLRLIFTHLCTHKSSLNWSKRPVLMFLNRDFKFCPGQIHPEQIRNAS